MKHTLSEIADQLDQASDALQMIAEGIAGPGSAGKAAAQIWTGDGQPINLRELAAELRQHHTTS